MGTLLIIINIISAVADVVAITQLVMKGIQRLREFVKKREIVRKCKMLLQKRGTTKKNPRI